MKKQPSIKFLADSAAYDFRFINDPNIVRALENLVRALHQADKEISELKDQLNQK